MLKRFWFVCNPDERFGVRNFGISATDVDEATDILLTYLKRVDLETAKYITKNMEIIEDIDIQLLDVNHIIPNMGVVTFKGIWWPNLNL